jgi:hypothetical protein
MQDQKLQVMGFYEIQQYRQGKLIKKIDLKNIITNTGLAEMAGLIGTDTTGSVTAFDYIAWGSDDTAAAATQTALIAEITTVGGQRAAGTGTRITTTTTNDTFQLAKSFTFTGSLSLREIGIFNASSVGTMLSRQTLVIDVISGDAITVTYKIIFSRA